MKRSKFSEHQIIAILKAVEEVALSYLATLEAHHHPRQRTNAARGLDEVRAWESATNGRGPWWNAGASHLQAAFPKSYFDRCELLSLRDQRLRLQRTS
ncbi:MAG TPA: hypothetical protein VN956_26790 [Pyrinomonadaceae bacterium]|nr:hypothetical protein [Pyrinomonadaceae bacterium]